MAIRGMAIHGGAGMGVPVRTEKIKKLMLHIANDAVKKQGATNMAVYAVRRMESIHFNAGIGAVAASDGNRYCDAGIMDSTGRCDSVCVYGGAHPIDIARKIMEKTHCMEAFQSRMAGRKKRGSDTVGAVSIDKTGRMSAAVSTGGLYGKAPGRIGDAAICGAGFYANGRAAAVATGDGDKIIKTAMCARICHASDIPAMIKKTVNEVKKDGGYAGVIAVEKGGKFHTHHSARHMACVINSKTPRFTI